MLGLKNQSWLQRPYSFLTTSFRHDKLCEIINMMIGICKILLNPQHSDPSFEHNSFGKFDITNTMLGLFQTVRLRKLTFPISINCVVCSQYYQRY